MNISMFRGDTQILDLTVTQDGVPVNIAGSTIWMTAKLSVDDLDIQAIFQVKTPTDIVIVNPAAGTAKITVPASATESMVIEKGTVVSLVYDIQVKTSTDVISTVDVGTITIRPDITRAFV